ncbi:MAG: ATP-binding protein [Gammaproteobacteria bacterium]|nr:ATP-binding protein [Gammaproteobacteria bacterium]
MSKALQGFPAVMVTGPRQSGKTTFLRKEFGEAFEYVTFDDPLERSFVLADPNGFLKRFHAGKPVILDEIQYVPELLPYIKMRIDQEPGLPGRWLLAGSRQFRLMNNISESLAGRVAILELLPFSLDEHPQSDLAKQIWQGSYPVPALYPERRKLWVRSYIQTYLERDIRQLKNINDLHQFETCLGLCAARHGQVFNQTALARDCGISAPTVKSWTGALEASYIMMFLRPYYRNYGKRLTKSPKLYYLDTVMVTALTRHPNGESALAGPMGGALFEGLIVTEAIKQFAHRGDDAPIYYWRSHDGLEVDLLVQSEKGLIPVEIKLTATPSARHIQPIERFKRLAGADACDSGMLICRVEKPAALPLGNTALPWQMFPEWLNSVI